VRGNAGGDFVDGDNGPDEVHGNIGSDIVEDGLGAVESDLLFGGDQVDTFHVCFDEGATLVDLAGGETVSISPQWC
jgi:hypothetical protein